MPDFNPPKLPETTHVVELAEFIRAALGEPFEKTDWFFLMKGKVIKHTKLFAEYYNGFNDEQEYLVLTKAMTISPTIDYKIILHDIQARSYKLGFIFHECILPDIKLNESNVGDCLFFNSRIGKMIVEGSQLENIMFSDNSFNTQIWIKSNSKCNHVWIKQHSLSGMINISHGSSTRGVWMSDDSQVDYIRIGDSSMVTEHINIRKTSKCGTISIGNNSWCEQINIEDNCRAGLLGIDEYSNTGKIKIENNSQCAGIFVRAGSRTGDILIFDNSRIDFIISRMGGQTGNIQIEKSSVEKIELAYNYFSLKLTNANVPLVHLNHCYLHELVWQAGTKGELYINGGTVIHLKFIKTALLREAVVSIINANISIVQLQELLVIGQFVLRNINVERIKSDEEQLDEEIYGTGNWNLKGKLTIGIRMEDEKYTINEDIFQAKKKEFEKQEKKYYDLKSELDKTFSLTKKGLLRIVDSSLGKTEISGSYLADFNFEYCDSKLLETFITGTQLPKNEVSIYNPPDQPLLAEKIFEQKTSAYNQLKKIFENQGDIVEATWYHSKAMENQKQLLMLRYKQKYNPRWRTPFNWFTKDGFDLFNFFLNRVSNNHGENWARALVFTLGISLLIYSGYFISVNYHKDLSWKGTGDFIGYYFSFLDLTHRIDFMVKETTRLNGLSRFLDFLGRVVIGYCIYQFIAAFRRHGRR